MIEIEKPTIECIFSNEDSNYGKFVVEPLERGYGTTLGNSLRRILLSSLPGAAVTSVKIDGILHEFSTIPGVKEDVTEIILNLKGLAIKNTSEGNEPKIAYIDVEGDGEVKGSDIKCDSDIEILNPDHHIATLSGGAGSKLYMEITINKGRGYVGADKNKKDDQPIGMLPVDSIFTPVTRVNFLVENTRVGQITDYDKLTLEVWTDGTYIYYSDKVDVYSIDEAFLDVTGVESCFGLSIKEFAEKVKTVYQKGGMMDVEFTKEELLDLNKKLNKIKPLSIGQAAGISGVNPADIAVLMVYLAGNK